MVSGIPSQSCPCKLPLWLQESARAEGGGMTSLVD